VLQFVRKGLSEMAALFLLQEISVLMLMRRVFEYYLSETFGIFT